MSLLRSLMFVLTVTSIGASASQAEEGEAKKVSILRGAASLEVPSDFKSVKRAFSMLEHEFQATAGKGDDAKTARLTMMKATGGIEPNIARWKTQLTGGDPEEQKTEEITVGDWKVHLVDLTGDYMETVGGGPFSGGRKVKRENYAMAAAILVPPGGGTYFVKMIGPGEVVKKNRKAFVTMIKSVR